MGKVYRVIVCGMKNVGKTLILEQVIYGKHKNTTVTFPTIEDIYVANVETDRGTRERIRFYDTSGIDPSLSPMSPTGDQSCMMNACNQLARQYNGTTDGYILIYDVSRSDSLDCLITMKKEIDKIRDKKEGFYVIVANYKGGKSNTDLPNNIGRAIQWANKEKLRHFEVNAFDKLTLYEPFTYLASKISSAPSKSSFSQLSVVRKSTKTDSG
ncbi:NF-kappa-B inhibitor-interacting Ras-like protein 2 [Planococcus citri]|uniref:NF-kappa-B inhibitor-interacting Ras-like protein 2 n=1 Tax=Planococcus citri TaxID=170843 RepID=UPI0031F7BD2E